MISFAEGNSENKIVPFLPGMSEKPFSNSKTDRLSCFNNCGITLTWIAFRAWGFCCDPHMKLLAGGMTPVFVTCCGASRVHCKLLQELSSPARCFCSSLTSWVTSPLKCLFYFPVFLVPLQSSSLGCPCLRGHHWNILHPLNTWTWQSHSYTWDQSGLWNWPW